ncbi:ABC transporter ATP-binding protein [Nostoc sphaeroides]|uniref:ABCB-BAC, ATP-binding cassette, subfamily B, bacterial n=1 Tax=Nostoc sphaeroides CCNUC1 TaxID=2653204 RepID=A0A5P8WBI8_9NOSO|nr:ABC transporter ATP-binding protein [Nostoc sphaeroides]MCC5632067.1 ABC transporter ATP-binding protein/permease [Nostoc sphaeroides CHAB 2801]QFS49974.1 ABCB-BAC, ATP-binding cassette, subfamily B, bacterial [Nostoc sphaeroides CCNUC1]
MKKKSKQSKSFQRAADAPNLPATTFRFICYFVNQFRWWYVAMVILEVIHATCGIMLPYAIGEIIRGVTRSPGESKQIFDAVSQPLMLFTALSLGEVVFGRSAGLLQTILHPIHRQHIVRSLYAYLQHHSHRYLSSSFSGALAHRISETSLGVTQTMQMLITEFMPVIIVYTVTTILLYRVYPPLAGFVGMWAVLFISISFWLATRCRIYSRKAAAARSETTGIIVDAVTNLNSSRLFARLGFERRYLNEQLRDELKEVRKSNWYSERIRWFQFISAAVLKIGTLYYSLSLWSQGTIATADFVVATSLSLLIISEARNLSKRFLEFFEHVGNIANGVFTIVQPHEIIDRDSAIAHSITQGQIEFRQVNFSYSLGKKVFDNLSITIQPGQRVGLVGFSGSGKSSFVNLILRQFDPQSGQILIDGVDIRDMTQDALHSQISLIPQDPSLFHRTLIENIRYGRIDATNEEVVEAARQAYAHDFIAQIKEGYDSLVGERGVKLSGGQRQRIAIARVILKDAPILILDEATSSLDSITEKAIQDTLDLAMDGKTVIVVAHRLSTIAHLDRILVFDQGRIIEDGTHAKLLARRGAYYRLWKMQAGGFLPVEANNQNASELQTG